jgi:hypothetical protein
MIHSNRYFHYRAFRDERGSGQQHATETDVLGSGAHFLALSNLDQDGEVERIAKISSFVPLWGVHTVFT